MVLYRNIFSHWTLMYLLISFSCNSTDLFYLVFFFKQEVLFISYFIGILADICVCSIKEEKSLCLIWWCSKLSQSSAVHVSTFHLFLCLVTTISQPFTLICFISTSAIFLLLTIFSKQLKHGFCSH